MGQLTPFETEVLADGVVSATEYERAVFETMECLDGLGVAHSDPELETDGPFPQWHYRVSGPDLDDLDSALAECENTYLRNVAAIWALQHEESEEVIQRRRGAFVRCLREAGIEVPDYDTWVREIEVALPDEQRGDGLRCREAAFGGPPP